MSQVMACDACIGYEDIINTQVKSFNGTRIMNLQQLAELVDRCAEEFFEFELEYNETLILSADEARAATEEVLKVHSIPTPNSRDIARVALNDISQSDMISASVEGGMGMSDEF